ncbi:hypothetical protein Vretimale_17455 [Volvox reticuliferus]|uniref:Pherophorin domain-containing protein n=1 Tax=Volvox reticuliferus TaxID=1737510 RepID=A0A8J4GT22_9CHLO|nr:hypothetical protein Vretifemale_9452 [Volvox reticuliferus]GIM14522.1 hypothetical protein Vretimale_17455 [Volvox reticuliferus]
MFAKSRLIILGNDSRFWKRSCSLRSGSILPACRSVQASVLNSRLAGDQAKDNPQLNLLPRFSPVAWSFVANKRPKMPLWFKMAAVVLTTYAVLATVTAQGTIPKNPPPAKTSPPPPPSPPSPPASCKFCFNLSVTNYGAIKPLTPADCTAIRSNLTTGIVALFNTSFKGVLSPFTGGCNISTGAVAACAAIIPGDYYSWKPSTITAVKAFQTILQNSLLFYLNRWTTVQIACSKKLIFTGSASSTGFCLPGHTHTVSCPASQ